MGNYLRSAQKQNAKTKHKAKVNIFDQIDERRAPNVKQYLRGVRNYYVLSKDIKVCFN